MKALKTTTALENNKLNEAQSLVNQHKLIIPYIIKKSEKHFYFAKI